MSGHFEPPKVSRERMQECHELCDQFKVAWIHGDHPRIEEWLTHVPHDVQPWLLYELIFEECSLRLEHGERIQTADYASRFPGQSELIDSAIDGAFHNVPQTMGGIPADTDNDDVIHLETKAFPLDGFGPSQDFTNHKVLSAPESPIAPQVEYVDGLAPTTALPPRDLRNDPFIGSTKAFDAPAQRSNAARPAEVVIRKFSKYELLEKLGQGGMGIVYKARDTQANRLVALKLIRADILDWASESQELELANRFRNEAQAAARLENDHVVRVYEVDVFDKCLYYAMQFVNGGSLLERLRKNPLQGAEAAKYIQDVAKALEYAHKEGILHRDLKPHNIMLDDDSHRALLADFGIAKLKSAEQQSSATRTILGTPPYMSPEQATDSSTVTEVSDVYSLGATLYHVLVGRPPFQAAEEGVTLEQVKKQEPVAPRKLNPDIDPDLETICLKCLEKEPARRYASARALADDLGNYLEGRPIVARPTPAWERAWKWARREPFQAGLIAMSAVCLLAFGVVGLYSARLQATRATLAEKDKNLAETDNKLTKERLRLAEKQASDKLDVKRHLTEAELAYANGSYLLADRSLSEALSRLPVKSEERQLWNDLIPDLERLRVPIENASRFVKAADQTEKSFGKVIFLSMPLALQGADKISKRGEAKSVAQAEFEALKKMAAADAANPIEALAALAGKNDIESGQVEEFRKQAEYLFHLATGQKSTSAFDLGLESLASKDGQMQDAIGHFSAELQQFPTHFWARFALGAAYLRQADAPLAEANFSACEAMLANRAGGDTEESRLNSSVTTSTDADEAAAAKRSAVPWLYLLRGMARSQLIDSPTSVYVQGADSDFEQAEKLLSAKDNSFALYVLRSNRGFARMRAKDFTGATSELESAIALEAQYDELAKEPMAHFNLALTCLQEVEATGHENKAAVEELLKKGKDALDLAIQRAPNTRKFLANKATLFFLATDFGSTVVSLKEAIDSLALAVQIDQGAPDDTAEEHVSLAELLLKRYGESLKAKGPEASSQDDLKKALAQLDLAVDAIAANRIRSSGTRVQAYLLRAATRMMEVQDDPLLLADIAQHSFTSSHPAQLRKSLRTIIDDATQVVLLPSADEDRRQAYGLRGRAAEALGDCRSAWSDFGEVIARFAAVNKVPSDGSANDLFSERRNWLMRRGWVALTPSVAQWADASTCFDKVLAMEANDPYALTGRACAKLRLGFYKASKESIDQAMESILAQRTAESMRTTEIKRRALHTKADVYSQLSVHEDKYGKREELQTQALAALREAFDVTKLDPAESNVDFKELQGYWQYYVEVDPDLQPLYTLRGFQELRRRFNPQSNKTVAMD